jgi:L-ascorbate metabolism protein UlaG (beta-lactamase superfamily)
MKRWLWRGLLAAVALLVLGLGLVLVTGCASFGRRAEGARLARMQRSPQWSDGRFRNPQPLANDNCKALVGAFTASEHSSPGAPPTTVAGDRRRFDAPPASGLRVTWLGHSSVVLEIDGRRVLIDPIFGRRASPLGWMGPTRWYPPPLPLAELRPVDAVLISHDHYDHLDHDTITALKDWNAPFVVPLGLGAHLTRWGVAETRIVELDWWESTRVGDVTITCTPARHASGRMLIDNDSKLWGGFALAGSTHRVYFSGDTGLFPALREVGTRLGPFDLTMIEVGQYDQAWPDWHIGPEQAVRAHQMVGGRVLLPIHWGLFTLAYHGWTEPIERAVAAARRAGVTLVAPRPGQSFEPADPPAVERWWPQLPWRTADQDPIVSTRMR